MKYSCTGKKNKTKQKTRNSPLQKNKKQVWRKTCAQWQHFKQIASRNSLLFLTFLPRRKKVKDILCTVWKKLFSVKVVSKPVLWWTIIDFDFLLLLLLLGRGKLSLSALKKRKESVVLDLSLVTYKKLEVTL